ncbi:SDR family NAD(P)-dependent oxidoreductase [Rhodococcus opacus]|nr:SDR family NAD(P)-dependent oxidoreductase [Rhodococcus opacus]
MANEELTEGRRFTGKTVIVTGGASGIGLAMTERFAHEGAAVFVADVGKSDEWSAHARARR